MKVRKRRRPRRRQTDIKFDKGRHGGRRANAGRPRAEKGRRPVAHRRRARFVGKRHPVHVTMRLRPGLGRLRGFRASKVLRTAFARGCDKGRFRICQFSVLNNHLHLICEASSAKTLARGIQGFAVRVARGMNRLWERKGSVFAERYHAVPLTSPTQTRNALCYVLQNGRRHSLRVGRAPDPFSSAFYFDGWSSNAWKRTTEPADGPPPVAAPKTYYLRSGWLRGGGLIGLDEVPAARLRPAEPG